MRCQKEPSLQQNAQISNCTPSDEPIDAAIKSKAMAMVPALDDLNTADEVWLDKAIQAQLQKTSKW